MYAFCLSANKRLASEYQRRVAVQLHLCENSSDGIHGFGLLCV